MPQFRLDAATEQRTIGADRFPLWAGPKGWQTACHNPSVIEPCSRAAPIPCARSMPAASTSSSPIPTRGRTMEALRSLDFVAVAATP
jgi:hypothetical protein